MKTISAAALIALLLLGMALSGMQAQSLFVKENGGTQIYLTLKNIHRLNLEEGNLTVIKTADSAGIYTISSIEYPGFTDFTTKISHQQMQFNKDNLFYPNPVSDQFRTMDESLIPGNTQVNILDFQGRLVKQLEQDNEGGPNDVIIDVSGLESGFYIFRLQIGNKAETSRNVKN